MTRASLSSQIGSLIDRIAKELRSKQSLKFLRSEYQITPVSPVAINKQTISRLKRNGLSTLRHKESMHQRLETRFKSGIKNNRNSLF